VQNFPFVNFAANETTIKFAKKLGFSPVLPDGTKTLYIQRKLICRRKCPIPLALVAKVVHAIFKRRKGYTVHYRHAWLFIDWYQLLAMVTSIP